MNQKWTEEELEAAVVAYIDMHRLQSNGQQFVKKDYYAKLADKFGRTEKSFEYRMQNISHVFELMGREWVSGLKPLKHVGSQVAGELEKLIAIVEEQQAVAAFQEKVKALRANPPSHKPAGSKQPKKTTGSVWQFRRDPEVTAWVLNEANDKCENCNNPAPFWRDDGSAFLEIHHVKRLADGGSDTVSNAVALCPNCHRAFHLGAERRNLVEKLYKNISRLKKEGS